MPLFQKSVVNKYLANLDSVAVAKAYLQFQQFYGDAERIENIRLLKEENYQEGFLREIFVDVLGYTINPNKNYNLTTEYKNETDSKKADGAILFDEKAIGVIELKSTTTPNLESIRDQAFNYKNNQPNCRFVITSNFEKLRFYIDNATDWEEFNLFNLDFENFRKFYLFLSKDSLFNGITTKLKDESKLHEEDITSKLYNDYSLFKHQLFNDLIKLNPAQDKLLLFHKSQKLLDRILFVLFAEDRGLVPPNAITRIIDQWKTLKDLDEEKSLYSRFVKLFHHLDEGHKYKEYELPAYNGGLFKKDSVLDSLIISDNILNTNTIKLSTYDYNTEVDVNILGHIFENSITEIEQVKAEIEGEQTDKNRSRRKKEGIFYTPKYITKYIVDNTVGALCNEKKKELGIDEIENEIIENSRTSKGKLSKKAEALLKKLDDYRAYLLSLKILDPACGSGAFLNQALEFLINEHELIDSYRRELEKDSLGLYDITKSILENNLYGVDINEEAVEIAKLSLWIRTAERGRKLSDLNSNIKCGNSLIDDPTVAGDKAFDWNKEFPQVFKTTSPSIPLLAKSKIPISGEREEKGEVENANGGFDVVIGNPPYVNFANLPEQLRSYFKKHYRVYKNKTDLYAFFIERSSFLKNKVGFLSFIVPHTWLATSSFQPLRELFITELNLNKLIELDFGVFSDAIVKPLIFISGNNKSDIIELYDEKFQKKVELNITQLKNDPELKINFDWNTSKQKVIERIFDNSVRLDNVINFTRGIKTSNDSKFLSYDKKSSEYKKLIRGRNIKAYRIDYEDEYIWYRPDLMKEKVGSLPHNSSLFEVSEKLITQRVNSSGELLVAYDDEEYYCLDTTNVSYKSESIKHNDQSLKYIIAILNSKLINWWFNDTFKMPTISGYELNQIPFKTLKSEQQKDYIENVEILIDLNKKFQEKQRTFLSRIQSNFTIDKLSNKLKEFYNYDFKSFVSELKKKKITLSLKQQDEWEQYFNEYKTEINKLQQQINQTDNEIDQLVYKLYGLTEEEIKIVEEKS